MPWLQLRKAEIKAAFRTPSLSLSPGEEVLSGEDLSFSSVGERNPWSRSLKQCVFTKPEGKVVKVTHREAAGWLRIIQVFSLTNQKSGVKGAGHHSNSDLCSHLHLFCVFRSSSFGLLNETYIFVSVLLRSRKFHSYVFRIRA